MAGKESNYTNKGVLTTLPQPSKMHKWVGGWVHIEHIKFLNKGGFSRDGMFRDLQNLRTIGGHLSVENSLFFN